MQVPNWSGKTFDLVFEGVLKCRISRNGLHTVYSISGEEQSLSKQMNLQHLSQDFTPVKRFETLYTFANNFRANKILIAAQYSEAKVNVSSEFKFGETNKSEQFLKKFPTGKVPAFEGSDGKCLFESNAIAHYVGNKKLRGETEYDQGLVQQWINYTDSEILPAMCTWIFPCLGIMQYNKQTTERAKEDVKSALGLLNNYLLTRTYLVGERITLADITVSCVLQPLYENVLEPNFRKDFGNVNRWFETLVNQPEFKAVLGDVKLCEKMAQFDAQKLSELQGKSGKSEKKKEKPKQEKKQQPKPKMTDEDDDDNNGIPEEPKKKDPFGDFPKGTFDMDDFKRKYSNESETVSVPYFWEKVDKVNYSIWYCEYKYPTELKRDFMSLNLISGMFQRLEKLRKNAFASMILSGVDNDSQISGIWVWKGHELAFTSLILERTLVMFETTPALMLRTPVKNHGSRMTNYPSDELETDSDDNVDNDNDSESDSDNENPVDRLPLSPDWTVDYESYTWTKLDINSPETKEKVDKYFSWTPGNYSGKPFGDGLIYK
ncbi:Elongation factor 1-gamma [Nymphon striatum]|nr:Elongation factor 1-gamma [Nymphon striatum]